MADSSTTTDLRREETPEVQHPEGVPHGHPSDWDYIKVAIILAVVTAVEVALPYLFEVEGPVLWLMMALMVVKFFLVVLWFMHLRFDSRLFSLLFYAGLVTAVAVYVAALAVFEFWLA